jgi:hypothetical protein
VSENSNRFIKLFYDKNYESILEGEITETGIGYVYKRKLSKFKELFMFRNRKKEEDALKAAQQMRPAGPRQPERNDSTAADEKKETR